MSGIGSEIINGVSSDELVDKWLLVRNMDDTFSPADEGICEPKYIPGSLKYKIEDEINAEKIVNEGKSDIDNIL